jgi:hypothetical protein
MDTQTQRSGRSAGVYIATLLNRLYLLWKRLIICEAWKKNFNIIEDQAEVILFYEMYTSVIML